MGIFTDSVEAERAGRLFNIRGSLHILGGRAALYVDGRRTDGAVCVLWRTTTLHASVDGARVLAEVKVGLFSARYRLFIDEEEVQLYVEPGTSAFSVNVPTPRFAFARDQRRSLSKANP